MSDFEPSDESTQSEATPLAYYGYGVKQNQSKIDEQASYFDSPDLMEEFVLGDKDKNPEAGYTSVIFNLVNNIIGGGMLALPFAMREVGMIFALILLAVIGFLSAYSAQLTVQASRYLPRNLKKSYSSLAFYCFGRWGQFLNDACMFGFIFGVLTAYLIVIGGILKDFLGDSIPPFKWFQFSLLLVLIFCISPLTFLKKVDSLKYASFLALLCILYIVVVVIIKSIQHLSSDGLGEEYRAFKLTFKVFSVIPIMSFAYTFHPNLFPIFSEMKNATLNRCYVSIYCSIVVCGVVYAAVGSFGYLIFLGDTKDNIFDNFGDGDLLIDIGKISLGVIMVLSWPLIHFPGRLAIDSILVRFVSENRLPDPVIRHYGIAVILMAASYVLSIFLPGIGIVFAFVGATAGNLLVFIGPALCFLLMYPGVWYKKWAENHSGYISCFRCGLWICFCYSIHY